MYTPEADTPARRPLQRAVRILLECILVASLSTGRGLNLLHIFTELPVHFFPEFYISDSQPQRSCRGGGEYPIGEGVGISRGDRSIP